MCVDEIINGNNFTTFADNDFKNLIKKLTKASFVKNVYKFDSEKELFAWLFDLKVA